MNKETRIFILGIGMLLLGGFNIGGYLYDFMHRHFDGGVHWLFLTCSMICLIQGWLYIDKSIK